MAASAEATLTELKQAATASNAVYATLKVRYTGAWYDDISQISTMVGVPVSTLLTLNPWLKDNNFVANNHDYITIKLTSGSPRTGGSNSQNSVTGFYSTSEWYHPLGVGTWYCTREFSSDHTAIDLTTGNAGEIHGYPIYAVKAGTVVQSYKSDTWGYNVLIKHEDTEKNGECYYTRYAHMEEAGPEVGKKVSQGEQVGKVGRTGTVSGSTGYHLHFQIYWTSATTEDYPSLNGHSKYGVNPNDIPEFPGIPYHVGQYTTVEAQKSDYISDEDIEIIQGAAKGDGSVTQEQFDATVNGIADKIIAGKQIDAKGEIAKIIRDFVKAQLEGIKSNALDTVKELLESGDFEATLNKFCAQVVNNAIYYVENKVNDLINYAIEKGKEAAQPQIDQAKSQLKSWVLDVVRTDPNSELGQSVSALLDNYVDDIVAQGWSAVRTAITTRDVLGAAKGFLQGTRATTINYVVEIGSHSMANAITSYLNSHIQNPDTAQFAADIAVGIINTTCQSIGMVMRGEITLGQAVKNVVVSAVNLVVRAVVQKYIVPVVTDWVITGIVTIATSIGGETIGATIGSALGGPIGAVIGGLIGAGASWIINKFTGWLFG